MKIYDCNTSQRITFIDRAKGSPRPDMYNCCLCWKSDTVLLIGWADSVKIALVKEKPRGELNTNLPSRYVEIICMCVLHPTSHFHLFQLSYPFLSLSLLV